MANLNLLRRSYLRNCDHLSLERTWQYWFTIVNTFAKVGITAAASVINFVVLTAALSGANSGIYSSSRMLYKLAHEGEAPKTFKYVSKRIVPSHAIIGITSGIFLGFMLNVIIQFFNKSLANVFVIIYSSSVLPGMVAWFVILLAELRFRRKNPHLMENIHLNCHYIHIRITLLCSC